MIRPFALLLAFLFATPVSADPGTRTVPALPFVYLKQEEGKRVWVAPLLLSGGQRDERRDISEAVVGLVGYYRRHADLDKWSVLFPIFWEHEDRKHSVGLVPPLFSWWSTKEDGGHGFLAGPLFWQTDPSGSTTALFPIYWRFSDRLHHATTQFLFPIAGWHQHDGAAGGFLGPLYGWGSRNDGGGFGFGVAPLLWFGKSGPRRHAMILPLFAHVADTRRGVSTTAVGPLFVRKSPDGGDGGLIPIVFAGRHADHRYAFIAPLFWHSGDASGSTNVVGPFYLRRGSHGSAFGLAPLFFAGDLNGHSHQVVFPLFWRFADARTRDNVMLAGPYYHRRTGSETADALFPLFYKRSSPAGAFGVTPIGGWRDRDGVLTAVVGPFIAQRNRNTGSSTNMLFPLLALHRSTGYSVTVAFPFFWRVHDGNETDTSIFPFYYHGRAPDHGFDALFPIFVHHYDKTAATTVVGPFWRRARRDGGRGAGVFPLFAYNKKVGGDGKQVSWFGMPGVWADRNDYAGTAHTFATPFFHFTRPDGYTSGLIPLVFAWRHGTASKVLTPIYYRQADRARDYSFDVFTLFYFGHEGKAKSFGLAPLFMAATHGDGTWRAGVLPLFYGAKRTDGSTLATLLGGWSTSASGKRWWLGPFYYRHDAERTSGAFFPLVYHTRNHVTDARLTYAFPLYFDRRNSEGGELQAYTPLVWRGANVEGTVTVGLPLFFDVNRFRESRTTSVLPLVVRNRSYTEGHSSYAFPFALTYFRTYDDPKHGGDGVFFPLFWRFGGTGERSTTVLAPLVWDFKRGGSRTTVFAPLGAYWVRPNVTHTLVLNTYYAKGHDERAGSWNFRFIPIMMVGRPRPHDLEWSVLEGLVGYRRNGRNRNLRLLWVLDFALSPSKSNVAWFSSTSPKARELF